jgi:hypothetical protein
MKLKFNIFQQDNRTKRKTKTLQDQNNNEPRKRRNNEANDNVVVQLRKVPVEALPKTHFLSFQSTVSYWVWVTAQNC